MCGWHGMLEKAALRWSPPDHRRMTVPIWPCLHAWDRWRRGEEQEEEQTREKAREGRQEGREPEGKTRGSRSCCSAEHCRCTHPPWSSSSQSPRPRSSGPASRPTWTARRTRAARTRTGWWTPPRSRGARRPWWEERPRGRRRRRRGGHGRSWGSSAIEGERGV